MTLLTTSIPAVLVHDLAPAQGEGGERRKERRIFSLASPLLVAQSSPRRTGGDDDW